MHWYWNGNKSCAFWFLVCRFLVIVIPLGNVSFCIFLLTPHLPFLLLLARVTGRLFSIFSFHFFIFFIFFIFIVSGIKVELNVPFVRARTPHAYSDISWAAHSSFCPVVVELVTSNIWPDRSLIPYCLCHWFAQDAYHIDTLLYTSKILSSNTTYWQSLASTRRHATELHIYNSLLHRCLYIGEKVPGGP